MLREQLDYQITVHFVPRLQRKYAQLGPPHHRLLFSSVADLRVSCEDNPSTLSDFG